MRLQLGGPSFLPRVFVVFPLMLITLSAFESIFQAGAVSHSPNHAHWVKDGFHLAEVLVD